MTLSPALARTLAFTLLALVLVAAFTAVITTALADWMIISDARLIPITATLIIPALLATWLCARFFDKAPVRSFGLGGSWRRALAESGAGACAGVSLVAGALAIIPVLGGAEITLQRVDPVGWVFFAACFFVAAAWEELIFRGYGFVHLHRGLGKIAATALVSGLFALAHLGAPGAGGIALLNIVLAGILFALALFRSGERLWTAIGLHWGWNTAQAMLFGVSVSGLSSGDVPHISTIALEGPDWLTGGAFGFEGSVAATAVLTAAILGLWAWPGLPLSTPTPPPPPPADGATSRVSPARQPSPDAPRNAP